MRRFKLLIAAALASVAVSTPAWADGTTAGVVVNNTATLAYQSGGVAQPGVTSNTAQFTVDRKITFTLTEVGSTATQVGGGNVPNQVTTFRLANTSNAPLDFSLVAANLATGTAAPWGGNDSFDVSNFRYAVDTNGDGVYTAGTDTVVTFIDELAADANRTVFVIADVPAGIANGGISAISLTGTALEGGTSGTQGGVVAQTTGAGTLLNANGTYDTVFGDVAGTDDAARDGKVSARDQYNVVSAALALVKSVRIVSDPFNGTNNPQAVPGAVLEYCIVAQNSGAAQATNVVISDAVPTQTTFVTGSGRAGGTAVGTGATATCDTTVANGGTAANVSGTSTATNFVTNGLTVAAGAQSTARFQVTVN